MEEYYYPPRIDKDESYHDPLKNEISKYIPSRGVYLLIFIYSVDLDKGTPLDRVLWLKAEIKRRYEVMNEVKDLNIKKDLYNQFKISELWAEMPYRGSERGNARKVAICLSQLYCIVFNRPKPTRKINYEKTFTCYAENYCSDSDEEEVVEKRQLVIKSMTKNFKILKRTNAALMIGIAQNIFDTVYKCALQK